jgi:hypothetical protein
MPVPHSSENFGDLVDPRFQEVLDDRLKQLKDMVPELFDFDSATKTTEDIRYSQTGTLDDWVAFEGTVQYDALNQGYDVTGTPLEFTKGVQIRRKLFDDGMYHVMDQKPKAMATSYMRTRQKHAAQVFTGAFSAANSFYTHSEGVALCSASHTTTAPATSTATGFSNLGTAALTAVAVAAARIQMRGFRGDRAERIHVMPDELWHPPNLYEIAEEISRSQGKLDTANNNINVHEGAYKLHDWEYMSNAKDWFMSDSVGRRDNLKWWDRVPVEFAHVEDFDTLIAKWRGYARYSWLWIDWRWVMGHNVA